MSKFYFGFHLGSEMEDIMARLCQYFCGDGYGKDMLIMWEGYIELLHLIGEFYYLGFGVQCVMKYQEA